MDRFSITLEELLDGEDIAGCPSCTLRIRIIFDEESLPKLQPAETGIENAAAADAATADAATADAATADAATADAATTED